MANFKGQPPEKALPPQDVGQQGEGAAADPKTQEILKKAKGYETVLMNLIHGEQTREEAVGMLKSNPDPLVAVPQAAMSINDMGLMTMEQGGIKVEPAVQLVASQYLIDDLIKLGQAAGAYQEEVTEDDVAGIVEDTYQMYIERGLIDKSIDPIQLQIEAEKFMTEEQAAAGVVLGQGKVPEQPTQQAMTEQYALQREHQAVQGVKAGQAKKQAQQKQQALQQRMSQGGGQ